MAHQKETAKNRTGRRARHRVIPYGRQHLNDADVRAVLKTLRAALLTQGPVVDKFDKALAKRCNATHAISCATGTAALHLAYLAAGITKGDEVIVTPNTFVATTNMLLALGAKPVFADIRLDTYNIDETQIERLITKRTRAIVPIHFAGHPAEMDAIMRIARKHRLLVIEDAAHALGATYKNKRVGSIGDLTTFSFHPVKVITTGEGGAVLTNNQAYAENARYLRSHGVSKDAGGGNVMTELGYNYRITDFQSALGLSQLKKLDRFLQKRRQVATWYERALSSVDEIVLPTALPHTKPGWHIYVIRVKNPKLRDPLVAHLKEHGIGANFHYPAVYSHPYYRKNGYKKTRLPNMEEYHKTTITLPLHPSLSKDDISFVADVIEDFFHK